MMTFEFPCQIYKVSIHVSSACDHWVWGMCVLGVCYYYVKELNDEQTLKFIRILFCATHTHNIIVFKCHNTFGFASMELCCGL